MDRAQVLRTLLTSKDPLALMRAVDAARAIVLADPSDVKLRRAVWDSFAKNFPGADPRV